MPLLTWVSLLFWKASPATPPVPTIAQATMSNAEVTIAVLSNAVVITATADNVEVTDATISNVIVV